MKDCTLINDLLPLYVDGICEEESRKYIEEHLRECPECRKTYEAMTHELPKLSIDVPDVTQIKPFDKIRAAMRLKTLVFVMTIVLIAAFAALAAGIIKKKSNNQPKQLYCNNDSIVILESVTDTIEADAKIDNIFLIIEEETGYLTNSNNGFTIYDNRSNQYYTVQNTDFNTSMNIGLQIFLSKPSSNTGIKISGNKLIELMKKISDQSGQEISKMTVALFGYDKLLYDASPDEVTQAITYYYDLNTQTVQSIEEFIGNNGDAERYYYLCFYEKGAEISFENATIRVAVINIAE